MLQYVNNIVQPESVDLSNPGNHLGASGFKDIDPLSCCDCSRKYYFTASEQAFYKSKNFEDQPKKCKQCRQLAKTSSPDTSGKGCSTVAPSTTGGWGSSGTTVLMVLSMQDVDGTLLHALRQHGWTGAVHIRNCPFHFLDIRTGKREFLRQAHGKGTFRWAKAKDLKTENVWGVEESA